MQKGNRTAGVNASQGQFRYLTWLSPQTSSLGDALKVLYFKQSTPEFGGICCLQIRKAVGEGEKDAFVLVCAGLSSSVGSASHHTAKPCRVSLAFALHSNKTEHLSDCGSLQVFCCHKMTFLTTVVVLIKHTTQVSFKR